MSDKDDEVREITEKLVELDGDILREARQELYKRDYVRIDQLLEEQSSLQRRLKRLGEE